MRTAVWVMVGLAWLATPARAEEPTLAIAPMPTGQGVQADLQRAFSDELSRALAAAGFAVKEPKEVDLLVAERPEFLQCTTGGCLTEEATFFRVARLLLPRLEVLHDGGVLIALGLYDAARKQVIAEVVERCVGCRAEKMRFTVRELAVRLHSQVNRPPAPAVAAEPPPPATPPVGSRRHGRLGVMKWVTFAAGLATAAVGGALWGIDGLGTCALSATQRQCPKVYDTLPAGAALVGIGGALLVTSFVMMGLDARNTDRPVAMIAPLRDGAALVLEGRF